MRNNSDELQPCETGGFKIGKGTSSSPNTSSFRCQYYFTKTPYSFCLHVALIKRKKRRSKELSLKQSFWKPVSFGYRRTFTSPDFQRINLKITSSYTQIIIEIVACMSRVQSSRSKRDSLNAQNALKTVTWYHCYVCIS
jgi:hypothetical protein